MFPALPTEGLALTGNRHVLHTIVSNLGLKLQMS